jgi:3-oxosteroid 1-dehydrogenase
VDETFDFVVVGSGGGSMCAGLFMRSVGKSVLILEKTELLGGTTSRSGGVMWIPNNPFMKAEGVPDSEEQAMTYLDAVVNDTDAPGATRERRLTYVREGPQMVSFLVSQGIKLRRVAYWPDYYDEAPGSSEEGRTVVAELFNVNELGAWKSKLRPNFLDMEIKLDEGPTVTTFKRSWKGKMALARVMGRTLVSRLTGRRLVTAGAALQGRMLQAALKAGVELRTNAPVKEILVENGRATGVVAVIDGKPVRIGARCGVLVNAGGFARNQEMRDKYIPGTSAEWTNSAEGDTGDMHLELMRIGAPLAQMEERVGNQMLMPPGHVGLNPMVQGELAKPHAILVDQTGVRYMNEGGSYMKFVQGMLKRNKEVPACPSWMIMDSQFMRLYTLAGTLPGQKKPRAWLEQGWMKTGATPEALAAACGFDPAVFKATLERYNASVRKGRDEEFGRGDRAYDRWLGDPVEGKKTSATLGTLEEGPFFAIPVLPGDVGTFGGVVTDAFARVLKTDGSVIEGLYATGNTTASVMGRTYPGAGASLGPSFTFGYVAAKHAAGAHNYAAQPAAVA